MSSNNFSTAPSHNFRRHSDLTPSSVAKKRAENEEQHRRSQSAPIDIKPSPPSLTRDLFQSSAGKVSTSKVVLNPSEVYDRYLRATDEREIKDLSESMWGVISNKKLDKLEIKKLVKIAIDKGDHRLIPMLNTAGVLDAPVLPDTNGNPVFHTALTYAISQQKSEAIAALLAVGVDVNQANLDGIRPIHLAVAQATQTGNTGPLKALLRGFPELRNFSDTQKQQLYHLAKTDPEVKACLVALKKQTEPKPVEELQFEME